MEEIFVTEIVDDYANHGTSKGKDGKDFDWSQSRVGLSNGDSTFIFNPIAINDPVEKRPYTDKNGVERTGYQKITPKKAVENAQHDELMSALKRIETKIDGLNATKVFAATNTPKATVGPTTKVKDDIAPMQENDEMPEDFLL